MEVQGYQGFVEEIDYNELEILEVCFSFGLSENRHGKKPYQPY